MLIDAMAPFFASATRRSTTGTDFLQYSSHWLLLFLLWILVNKVYVPLRSRRSYYNKMTVSFIYAFSAGTIFNDAVLMTETMSPRIFLSIYQPQRQTTKTKCEARYQRLQRPTTNDPSLVHQPEKGSAFTNQDRLAREKRSNVAYF